MWGEMHGNAGDLARAALFLDLHLAGVRVECGEELFAWNSGDKKKENQPVKPELAPVVVPVQAASEMRRQPELARAVDVPAAVPLPLVVRPVVWCYGQPAPLVVVIKGDGPLDGKPLELLRRMLAAVGVEPELAWVGVRGLVGKADEAIKAELVVAIEASSAREVLVLGQDVLGVLAGKNMGVEGWHAAPVPLVEKVRLGVTYPLELLLAQPLFKRLAWQHLCAWRERI